MADSSLPEKLHTFESVCCELTACDYCIATLVIKKKSEFRDEKADKPPAASVLFVLKYPE